MTRQTTLTTFVKAQPAAQLAQSPDTQALLNQFYNLDNLVSIEIDIGRDVWDKLRNATPKGEWGYKGARYDWYQTNSVTVSSREFKGKRFQNVGIIKKSFMGSKDNVKPSFRLDFSKFQKSNEAEIEALIGTKTLVLNNCRQDPLFIRQPLGYRLMRQVGIPCFRCNLATVSINGATPMVYVNIEPFKKPLLANVFNFNTKGNAYEIEYQQDLVLSTWRNPTSFGTPSFEGYSDFADEKDIKLLAQVVESRDWNAIQKVIDIDAFIKFTAMETLLKHWDGFSGKINNTFVYNDTTAVANPNNDNTKFKFIPSGIDQILQNETPVVIRQTPLLAQLLLQNANYKAKLYRTIRDYANGEVFSTDFTDRHIERLATVLRKTSTPNATINTAIGTMKQQIRQVREQAIELTK